MATDTINARSVWRTVLLVVFGLAVFVIMLSTLGGYFFYRKAEEKIRQNGRLIVSQTWETLFADLDLTPASRARGQELFAELGARISRGEVSIKEGLRISDQLIVGPLGFGADASALQKLIASEAQFPDVEKMQATSTVSRFVKAALEKKISEQSVTKIRSELFLLKGDSSSSGDKEARIDVDKIRTLLSKMKAVADAAGIGTAKQDLQTDITGQLEEVFVRAKAERDLGPNRVDMP